MNIIKFKDIVMPGDSFQAVLFNEHLKGKYAYWVRMRYVVSFDHMDSLAYIACEEDINKLLPHCGKIPMYGAPYFDTYCNSEIIPYIDQEATEIINSDKDLRIENECATDEDITLDEIKNFRTWLATELLKMDMDSNGNYIKHLLTESDIHMLEYYKNDMNDATIDVLEDPSFIVSSAESKKVGCGCGCQTCGCNELDLNAMYGDVNLCDPVAVYRKRLYLYMVNLFSDISFWTRFPKAFAGLMKKYIDNIIKAGLPFGKSDYSVYFRDCTSAAATTEQDRAMNILQKLSNSLEYIQKGNVEGHKNYIHDALNRWSAELYELMIWG